jgi:hypothetical protein
MKHIKLFESFNTTGIKSGDNVYVVLVNAPSGPDYGFSEFVFFRASNVEEAKENFAIQMIGDDWKDRIADNEIATRDYSDFNDFINDIVDDEYFRGAGWTQNSGYIYDSFPFQPFMKLYNDQENIAMLDSLEFSDPYEEDEGIIDQGRLNEELAAIDKMSDMVGEDKALELFLTWKFDWKPNTRLGGKFDEWFLEIPSYYQALLAKYNKNLSPEDIKDYQAVKSLRKRII